MSLYKRSSENVTSMPGCNLVQRLVFEFKTPEQISFSAAKVETIFTTIPSILQNEMFRYPSFTSSMRKKLEGLGLRSPCPAV